MKQLNSMKSLAWWSSANVDLKSITLCLLQCDGGGGGGWWDGLSDGDAVFDTLVVVAVLVIFMMLWWWPHLAHNSNMIMLFVGFG